MITLVIIIDNFDSSKSLPIGFVLWGISPYLLMAWMVEHSKTRVTQIATFIVTIMCVLFGTVTLGSIYFSYDAQSALVFLFAPLWQWLGLLILCIPLYFMNKLTSKSNRGSNNAN
ncbi:hypothetical protein [Pseudoalteromonas sp. NCCP-2140]|uniref:hypothetical protein n=1 Tax=Pseudoalteromonas sp. NCCP-2140 TaxID=2942288 RepID=UPI002040F3E2|nr:hypothetical protein [Pseudoalteromonas sp. NCCP-2140]